MPNKPKKDRLIIDPHKNQNVIANPPDKNNFRKAFVFVSYSKQNKKYLKHFKDYCHPIKHIGIWDDLQIEIGDRWEKEIIDAMTNCKVGVMLVSYQFLATEYIVNVELPYLLASEENNRISLLNVLITKCLYEEHGLNKFQFVNNLNKPLDSLVPHQRDVIWDKLAKKIMELYNLQNN